MGFGFWGPKKGPKRAESELVDKVQDPRTPVAYQVRPVEASVPSSGARVPYSHELVRRTDVERHLQNAPAPFPGPGAKSAPQILGLGPRERSQRDLTRPKEFKNHGRIIPRTGHYTEYPTTEYPYHNQTAKSGGKITYKTAKGKMATRPADPGYVRTITNQEKHIQGVLYHPKPPQVPGLPPTNAGPRQKSGALYPSQEVYRAQTFGPRQTYGPPVYKE